jgi:predicted CoA-binding protein
MPPTTRAGFGHLVAREHDEAMSAERGRLLRSDDEIDGLLARTRSVAVVGVSGDSRRPSRRVTAYLIGTTDWTVYLVNPNIDTALGRPVYPSLADLPESPDIVDVFRRTDHLPQVVDAAIAVGAGAVWFQLGLVHDEAAATANAAGLDVVQDHCLRVELYRWHHAGRQP